MVLLRHYLAKAVRLLRQRKYAALFQKIRGIDLRFLKSFSHERLHRTIRESSELVVVLSGAIAGGAKFASQSRQAEYLAAGISVCRIGEQPLLGIYIELLEPIEGACVCGRTAKLPELGEHRHLRIELDSLVGFTDPRLVCDWLKVQIEFGHNVTVYWHDHYMICPSHFLLSRSDRFCNIPRAEQCASCLPGNMHCINPMLRSENIVEWRELWSEILNFAVSIEVFSPSSKELILRAWSPLLSQKVVLRPHSVEHIQKRREPVTSRSASVVAVVGQIGLHKGALKVAELSEYIAANNLDLQILIIGTLEVRASPEVVRETGPYKVELLAKICKQYEVGAFWFPSIWPETFSYVIHEIKALGLPILSFDLGAQRDYLEGVANSCIIDRCSDSEEIYLQIKRLLADGVQ